MEDEEDEEDEGSENGSQNHHTLRLARSIALKSEIFCLTFSDDGRCALLNCLDGIHAAKATYSAKAACIPVWLA